MNKEIAMLWAEQLEIQGLPQGKERLCDDRLGYCCLGVLSDLREQLTGEEFNQDATFLPTYVCAWAGMSDNSGGFRNLMRQGLSNLNDQGIPFPEIAKIIRKHWKEL